MPAAWCSEHIAQGFNGVETSALTNTSNVKFHLNQPKTDTTKKDAIRRLPKRLY